MAYCFTCNKEIGYWEMVRGAFRHLKRNFYRKNLVVFNCPHCGILCQETAWSYYAHILIFFTVLMLFLWLRWINGHLLSDWRYVTAILGCYFLSNFVWWKYVSRLKEPFIFWREH